MAIELAVMPKNTEPKGSEPKKFASIKIDEAIVKQARLIAARRGVSIAVIVSDILRSPIQREYDKVKKDIAAED